MIDGHGDDIFRYGKKIRINFSTNIPQNVNHSGLMLHLYQNGDVFRNYPEPEPRSVEQKIAVTHGLKAENVIVTNGAIEAIYLIAHSFAGCNSAIISPTFREYQDACRIFNHSIRFIEGIEDIDNCQDCVWLCNPNNPTGEVYDRTALLKLIDGCPHPLFIIDQAYAAYSVKEVLSVSDIMQRRNVVMLNSLTKQYVVPGLRIGYAIGAQETLARLRSLRMPWAVNSIAIQGAHYLLDHKGDYRFDIRKLHDEAQRLAEALREIGMAAKDTDCNFILGAVPYSTASELKNWLIDQYGILIRDASNFENLTSRHFRIAAQSRDENDLLIKALKEWNCLFQ